MTMKLAGLLLGLASIATTSSWADPMLAVVARGDGAVNLYRVQADGIGLSLTKSIPVGKAPGEMCLDPNGKRIFVSNVAERNVAVIDLATQEVTADLTAPDIASPDGCVVSPDSRKLYVLDQKANAAFVFSTDTNQLLKKIAVGQEPRRAIFSPEGRRLLVSNAHSNSLSVIDPATDTVGNTVKTGTEPRALSFSPDGKTLAVSIIDDDCASLYKADTLEFKQQFAVAQSPQRIIYSPDGKLMFVLGKISDEIAVVRIEDQSSRMAGTIRVTPDAIGATNSWGMAMTPNGRYLYVSNIGEGIVSIVDAQLMRTFRSVPVGKQPMALLYIP